MGSYFQITSGSNFIMGKLPSNNRPNSRGTGYLYDGETGETRTIKPDGTDVENTVEIKYITGKLPPDKAPRGTGYLYDGKTGERTTINPDGTITKRTTTGVTTNGQEARDPVELETIVAHLLNMSPSQFARLSETEKQLLVAQYNMQHPDNPIPDKQRPDGPDAKNTVEIPNNNAPDSRGSEYRGTGYKITYNPDGTISQEPTVGVKMDGKEIRDPVELETIVAHLLNMSPSQFARLSETEKQLLVAQYNMQHPDNPIPDKQR